MGAIASGVFTCGHPKSVSAALHIDPFGHRAGERRGPFRPLGGQPAARLAGRNDPVRPTGGRPGRLEGPAGFGGGRRHAGRPEPHRPAQVATSLASSPRCRPRAAADRGALRRSPVPLPSDVPSIRATPPVPASRARRSSGSARPAWVPRLPPGADAPGGFPHSESGWRQPPVRMWPRTGRSSTMTQTLLTTTWSFDVQEWL